MSTPNPNTLDPEEIRKLPVRRDLPLNGLTEAQVRAIGADPKEVEAGRLSHNIWADQQRRNEDAQLALAAQQAVAEGEVTYAEAAQALLAAGRHDAHDAVVRMWREEEGQYAAQSAADERPFMDAEEYAKHFAEQQVREREQLAQQAAETARQLEAARLQQLIDQFNQFVESTPGAHNIAPAVEKRMIEKIKQDGNVPATEAEAQAFIESALKESAVLGDATKSIRQQVHTEWRIHRKNNGARDGIVTEADIARAEAHFKQERFKQLADSKMINLEELKPGPTAEETSAAITERYSERQANSTDFRTQVGQIESRGKDRDAAKRAGVSSGFTEERDAYREAVKRAEQKAQYGEVKTAGTPEEPSPKPGGYGPDGSWPDELGPAL